MSVGHASGHGDQAHAHLPRGLGLALAIVLGFAAITAGVVAWRAQVLSGHAVEAFTLSTQAVNDANTLASEAERSISGDRQLFIEYQNALQAGNATQAASILAMMSTPTRRAVGWWEVQPSDVRPRTPFVSGNPDWNAPGKVVDAQAATARADAEVESARENLTRSHRLEFIAALLTVAFLAGGLSGVFESRGARLALISVSGSVLGLCILGAAFFW